MSTKETTSKRAAVAAGKTLKNVTEGKAAKKVAGSALAQAKKVNRRAETTNGRDFDARLEAAHARIDGVLRRLG